MFQKVIKSEDNMYYVFGAAEYPPENEQDLLIVKIDTNLDIVWHKIYDFSEQFHYPRKILKSDDNGYHLISWVFVNYYNHLMLCRLSRNMDTIKSKIFTNLGNGQFIFDSEFNNDSSRLYVIGEGYNGTASASRLTFDTNYRLRYSNTIPERTYGNMNIKWITDSTLLIAGLHIYNDKDIQHDDLKIAETDTSFSNIVFHKFGAVDTINYPAAVKIFDFINKDSIFLLGTHDFNFDIWPEYPSWISVRQLDRSLTPRVEAFYGGDAYYISYCILSTSDGGCLISASRYNYLNQNQENDIYFLKLKRDDLITSNDDNVSFSENQSLLIYPNPGKDKIIIKSQSENASFCLYNINGEKVFCRNIKSVLTKINCSGLSSGLYVYSLITDNNEIISGKWVKK